MPYVRSVKPLLTIPVVVFLVGCQNDRLSQTGYFKDAASNRVFEVWSMVQVSDEELTEYLELLPHTVGRMTIAYVYENDVKEPPDHVTLASDFLDANENALANSDMWRWWFRRDPAGRTTLIDCLTEGSNSICDGE